jgi:hypothetical protein
MLQTFRKRASPHISQGAHSSVKELLQELVTFKRFFVRIRAKRSVRESGYKYLPIQLLTAEIPEHAKTRIWC